MKSFLSTAVLAVSAITVRAQDASCGLPSTVGSAAVINRCSFPVALWSVADESTPMLILDSSTPGYKEEFRFKTGCGGPSIKVAPYTEGLTGVPEVVAQFEYTPDPDMNLAFFDLSYVNGDPMKGSPVTIQPSDPSCPTVSCANNDQLCMEAYNAWNDTATKACGLTSDLLFTLCPDNSDNSTSTTSSSAAASPPDSSASSSGNPVVVTASGLLGEGSPQPAAGSSGSTNAPASSSASTSSSSSGNPLNDLGALDFEWLGPTSPASIIPSNIPPSKRAAEPETAAEVGKRHAHAHVHAHEKMRRSRVFRHSH